MSYRGPSAYQPNALLLGHTSSKIWTLNFLLYATDRGYPFTSAWSLCEMLHKEVISNSGHPSEVEQSISCYCNCVIVTSRLGRVFQQLVP